MKDGLYRYPMSCHSGVDPNPPPSFDRPILKATLIRPGVFRFDFDPPRLQSPIVLATASNRWGVVPRETSSVRVIDVDEAGFTIETFQSAELINPTNVGFFFVILGESSPAPTVRTLMALPRPDPTYGVRAGLSTPSVPATPPVGFNRHKRSSPMAITRRLCRKEHSLRRSNPHTLQTAMINDGRRAILISVRSLFREIAVVSK
jgi:hypothetical protein